VEEALGFCCLFLLKHLSSALFRTVICKVQMKAQLLMLARTVISGK
jgi:hypothetical protein